MCGVCERIKMIQEGSNPYFVCQLETGYVVIGDHQRFKGYTLFLCKQHAKEIHDLPYDFRCQHMLEVALVEEAVANVFKPDKMNIESLGNGIEHVHWHYFPRFNGDTPVKGPVWWLPKEEMYNQRYETTTSELEEYKIKIRNELNRLQAKRG